MSSLNINCDGMMLRRDVKLVLHSVYDFLMVGVRLVTTFGPINDHASLLIYLMDSHSSNK
jgi:hypothetical protein